MKLTEDELREELCKITHWQPDSTGIDQLVELVQRLTGPDARGRADQPYEDQS